MLYNLVSLKQVIAKVYGDLALAEIQHPVSDFISWGAEAVERIGAVGALESKVAVLTLKDYNAKLPNDFKLLSQAAYAVSPRGPWFVMHKSAGNFFAYKCQSKLDGVGSVDIYSAMAQQPLDQLVKLAQMLTAVNKSPENAYNYVLEYQTLAELQSTTLPAGVICLVWQPTATLYIKVGSTWTSLGAYTPENVHRAKLSYEEARMLVLNDPFIRQTMIAISQGKQYKFPEPYDLMKRDRTTPTYQVWGGVLKCSHRWGNIALSYRALPLDDEGYPMLPDHPAAIEACYWYIVMKFYYPKWAAGELRDQVYMHAQQSWNHYCRQSYGIAQMPDQGDMQGIKNQWLRLIPDLTADDRGFEDLYNQDGLIFKKDERY